MTLKSPKSDFSDVIRKTARKHKRNVLRGKSKGIKPKKVPIGKLQKQLWLECKRIIRKRYGNTCFTCGRTGLAGSNWHTGHLLAKASVGAILKYDLRILRPQCYNCNINYGGNGAVFIENLRKKEGDEYVEKILQDRSKIINAYDHYLKLLEEYGKIETEE